MRLPFDSNEFLHNWVAKEVCLFVLHYHLEQNGFLLRNLQWIERIHSALYNLWYFLCIGSAQKTVPLFPTVIQSASIICKVA